MTTPKPEKVTLSLPGELKREARARAIRENKNLSMVVTRLLELWIAGGVDLELPATEVKEPKQ